MANTRKHVNKIHQLMDDVNCWVADNAGLWEVAKNYFTKLFTASPSVSSLLF